MEELSSPCRKVKVTSMKLNVSKEYIRRLKKVLKSKLNSGSLVRRVNTWAVSLFPIKIFSSIC